MIAVRREFEFCCAHRLLGYEGPCANLHGHNYRLIVEVSHAQEGLDGLGMVVDFTQLKGIGKWLDDFWDHHLLVNRADRELIDFANDQGWLVYPLAQNPTVEYMLLLLHNCWVDMVPSRYLKLRSMELWETSKCSARWEAPCTA